MGPNSPTKSPFNAMSKDTEFVNFHQAAALLGWPVRGSCFRGMVRRFPAHATGPRGGKLFKLSTVESWRYIELHTPVRIEKQILEAVEIFAPIPVTFRFGLLYALAKVDHRRHRLPTLLWHLKSRGLVGWQIMRHVANWPGRPCRQYFLKACIQWRLIILTKA